MTGAERVFVDTNVLVYAAVAAAPAHATARGALEDRRAAGAELWISRQILREYVAVLTRPQTFLSPVQMTAVVADVRSFERQFRVADDTGAVTAELLQLLEEVPAGGKQIHDANIVATMIVHEIDSLLTANAADFARFRPRIAIATVEV
ncbi:MAG: type II toxin-antitoxin system VapC family toxin [Longimicrobiaceae bacterium]